jgi:hypothetical protein
MVTLQWPWRRFTSGSSNFVIVVIRLKTRRVWDVLQHKKYKKILKKLLFTYFFSLQIFAAFRIFSVSNCIFLPNIFTHICAYFDVFIAYKSQPYLSVCPLRHLLHSRPYVTHIINISKYFTIDNLQIKHIMAVSVIRPLCGGMKDRSNLPHDVMVPPSYDIRVVCKVVGYSDSDLTSGFWKWRHTLFLAWFVGWKKWSVSFNCRNVLNKKTLGYKIYSHL